jgi:hypothetical protein
MADPRPTSEVVVKFVYRRVRVKGFFATMADPLPDFS